LTLRPETVTGTSPVEMGLRLLKSGGQPEIFCKKCNVWLAWDFAKGKDVCPGCWTKNEEAAALIGGLQAAKTILTLGGVDGSQQTASSSPDGPER
jgi:hypothetical protein